MLDLKPTKNEMAKDVFGMSLEEAWAEGLCIKCREPAMPKCYSDAGRKEFRISGLCEPCFDKICER